MTDNKEEVKEEVKEEIKQEEKHEDCKCKENDKKCCHEHKKHSHDNNKLKEKEAEIEKLKKELEESVKKVQYAQAELVNYRKRKDEEVARMMKYASEDMVKEMLPIVDSFERAIEMDDDNLDDEVSKFLAGFKMIYCNLVHMLEKYEVKEIEAMGKEFDANFHQAVLTEPKDGVEPGMVIEVLQKGYIYKDKVIRPSMVKVSE